MRRVLTAILLLMVMGLGEAFAQEFNFGVQLRERSEFDAKEFSLSGGDGGSNYLDVYHYLRTRFRADATVNEHVNVVVELQDSRKFGTEGGTLNDGFHDGDEHSNAFDVRQAFVHMRRINNTAVDAKVGRMVLSYANQRLLGAIDWNNFGQSFDGGVLTFHMKNASLDIIGAAVDRNDNTIRHIRDEFLAGAWFTWNPMADQTTVQVFYLYTNPMSMGMDSRMWLHTPGIYVSGETNGFDYAVDGAFQFGEFPNVKLQDGESTLGISAYMAGVRAGYTLPGNANFRIGAGVDILSGDDPAGEGEEDDSFGAFNTLFATNHKFYGHMDYFPGAIGDLGLMDIIVQLSAEPRENFRVGADFHMFSIMVDPADFPGNEDTEIETNIGMELDLYTQFQVVDAVWSQVGVSVIDLADRVNRPVLRGLNKTNKWAYIMLMVNV
ncbi:MAG: hypothetical protein CL946_02000 [Ectothiorhodospiraceae bacterium]|nr:hypothetical protein [Ectothiorhodospiraceae bacterium]